MGTEQRKIKNILINNTLIANQLRQGKDIAGYKKTVNVGRKGSQVMVSYGISKNLSYFDMTVADAVYTLHMNKFETISAGQVMRVLSGNPQQSLSRSKKREIEESIEKLRETMLWIDCEKEMLARGTDRSFIDSELYRRFLPCEKTPAGKYRFTGKMPLYEYMDGVNRQMIAAPVEWLRFPNRGKDGDGIKSDTTENVLIKWYLIQWLSVMKNPNNQYTGNKIDYWNISYAAPDMYTGMLPQLGEDREACSTSAWNRKVERIHKKVVTILECYKEMGYIEGYEPIYGIAKSNHISGVRIQIEGRKEQG
ncbi:MAG: hypothetical protein NC124_03550 [Clostridium sp.]|nr:hypothetical protein [Clostridium sp.]